MGKQQVLGYMLTVLASISEALADGKTDLAQRRCLSGIGAVEQFDLDGNWDTAWKLFDLEPPPFEHWGRMNTEPMKKEYPTARLIPRKWIAALIAELRDEDFLRKRRGGKGGGKRANEDE